MVLGLDGAFGAVGQIVDYDANGSCQNLGGHPGTVPCTLGVGRDKTTSGSEEAKSGIPTVKTARGLD